MVGVAEAKALLHLVAVELAALGRTVVQFGNCESRTCEVWHARNVRTPNANSVPTCDVHTPNKK